MSLISRFKSRYKDLQKITKVFIQQPQLSFKRLTKLPATLRGFNYSQEWQPSAVTNKQPSFSGLPAVSQSSNPLKSYINSHKEGKGILKWDHYFDIYHQHFKKFVGHEVHILEIGVFSGGSLEMWRDYFGSGCHIYGVDIQEECKMYESEYTNIFIGDQADHKFWKLFKDKVPVVDILIDDGGHQAEQQIVTLEEMLPHLSPGGIYFCEDIHGSYNDFASYLHGLINSLNDMIQLSESGISPTQFQSWIKSMHFYPYVTVIEKAERPEEKIVATGHGTEWQPFLKF